MSKPTKNGLYWLYREGCKPTVVSVYGVDAGYPSVCFLGSDMDEDLVDIHVEWKWIGPITPPVFGE